MRRDHFLVVGRSLVLGLLCSLTGVACGGDDDGSADDTTGGTGGTSTAAGGSTGSPMGGSSVGGSDSGGAGGTGGSAGDGGTTASGTDATGSGGSSGSTGAGGSVTAGGTAGAAGSDGMPPEFTEGRDIFRHDTFGDERAQMGEQGQFFDPRIGVEVFQSPDRVTPQLPALYDYQASLERQRHPLTASIRMRPRADRPCSKATPAAAAVIAARR